MSRDVLLALDASAGPASVALFIDGALRDARRIDRQGSAELLAPTISAMLGDAGLAGAQLTAIAVGEGPGSFTGLRVAAALAKGLARGAGATLHAMPSLPLIAAARDDASVGRFLCVLDALRGEWFVQAVTCADRGHCIVEGPVERLPVAAVHERAAAHGAVVIGPPVDPARQPEARAALVVGIRAVARDAWEPDYGRLAEAQVQWEATHARALPAS
ncbi:MAG: tRNA (adenosine(37)-N6)-threonylcarbamoyltransferase complex dimerization subunit type 1 TsaB [Gemmatimonadaceae bacterium]|nr:tRNA (adenosine(37)-N6)-threonylcarbamoyltransferase complex dimerization subunit type 1 TsaB [Gemmatimonadaceae bacterium]